MLFNVLAWNVRGIMSTAYSLSQLLDTHKVDTALISEHKLMPHSQHFMNSIHSEYDCYTVIQNDVDPYSRARCRKGEVCIMYRKCLNSIIAPIESTCDRICGIEVRSQHSLPLYISQWYRPRLKLQLLQRNNERIYKHSQRIIYLKVK